MTPTFSRIEIRHGSPVDLMIAAAELTKLARRLRQIANEEQTEEVKNLIAHHAIRVVSSKLRGTEKPPRQSTQ